MGGVAARIGGQAGIAGQSNPLALMVEQQGIVLELPAQHRGQALQPAFGAGMLGRQAQGAAAIEIEGEADPLVRHGLALDLFGDGQGLATLGLHELQTRRRGVEQVAHLGAQAVVAGERRRLRGANQSALHRDREGVGRAAGARGQGQAGHRADRRQGFAAETEGGDVQQVPVAGGVGGQLGGGVALDGQGQVLGRQTRAVVDHQDARQAALLDLDLDAASPGVDGVLDQLFHGAGRALDHLAGGDAVDGFGGETADGHLGSLTPP